MEPFFLGKVGRRSEATRTEVDVVTVVNDFYGDSVTVAGLLAGRDIQASVGDTAADELLLLPAEAVNSDGLFIDSMPLSPKSESDDPSTSVQA